MSTLRLTLVIAVALLALSGCARPPADSAPVPGDSAKAPASSATTPRAADSDEAEIRDAGAARDAALRARDAAAMSAFYAGDAVLMPEAAKLARGSADIRQFLDVYMKLLGDGGYTLAVGPAVEIEVSGNLAFRSGTYAVTDKTGATIDTGKWLESWRKAEGKWQIVRDIRNSDMLTLFAPTAYTEGAVT